MGRSRRESRPAGRGPGGGRLREAVAGAFLVAQMQVRQTWRHRRHRIAVGAWIAATYLLLALGWTATGGTAGVLLALVSFGSLSAGLCVAPAVAATRLARERETGILPFLQVSGVRPGGLAAGAWCTGIAVPAAVLLATLPALGVATYLDESGWAPLAQSLAAHAAAIGAVAGLAVLCASWTRTRLAALSLAYVGVTVLAVGTLVAYALASSATAETARLPVRVAAAVAAVETPADGTADASAAAPTAAPGTTPTVSDPDEDGCVVVTQDVVRFRPDRVWGFLALNPYVVLADALPGRGGTLDSAGQPRTTPVEALSTAIRQTRMPPGEAVVENCVRRSAQARAQDAALASPTGGPVWPLGVGALSGIGALALWLAARSLRTPADRVGRAPSPRLRALRQRLSWRRRTQE